MRNADRRSQALEALLSASLSVLGELGYARLRTADVAKRSGMSEGTLFRYFPTKYDLVRASLEEALNQHVHRLADRFSALQAPVERRKLLVMLWELIAHPDMAWTFELFAAAYTDEQLRQTIAPVLNAHTETVDSLAIAVASEIAGISERDAGFAINLATWAMQGLVLRNMSRGDLDTQYELIDYLDQISGVIYDRGDNGTSRSTTHLSS
jgi:AcrR family transcriptional regulator